MQMKKVWEYHQMKNKCDYDDLYVKGNKLSQADVFENFQNISHKANEFDPTVTITYTACIKLLADLLIN